MFVVMNRRWLLLCGFLFLLCASGAEAGRGVYQRTKDNKCIIWNPDPKHDETATWSGEREKRYASGPGTLTWYKIERKFAIGSRHPIEKFIEAARWSGNMVRGKFEGPVESVDAKGKTLHAMFADGRRSEEWAVGPAPAPGPPGLAVAPSPSPVPGAAALPAQSSGVTKQPGEPEKRDAVPAESARRPTPGPSLSPAESPKLANRTGVTSAPSPLPSSGALTSFDKRSSDLELQALALSPEPTPIPQPRRSSASTTRPAAKAPSEGPLGGVSPSPSPDRATEQRVARVGGRTRPQANDFLRSLAMPPAAAESFMTLQNRTARQQLAATTSASAPSATAPPAEAPSTSITSAAAPPETTPPPAAAIPSPPRARPQLSTTEVIGLADAEARTQGYDLNGYECSKLDYTVANDTWSVSYDQKRVEGTAEAGRQIRVTIEDKTKKTSVAPGR